MTVTLPPRSRSRARLRRAASALGLLVLVVPLLSGCARNPVTGARQFVLFTEGQEIQMGREADQHIVRSLGIYEAPELERLLDEVGQAMAAGSERPQLPWTFRVLDDPTVNAFALPGGYIYMTRGILAHLSSEAQLAGIVGHEIGHVTARHGVVRVSRAQIAQFGLGVGMILAPELQPFGEAVGAGLGLLFLSHSRDAEREADDLGVRYMRADGYDPRELAGVFRMLARASGARDGDRIPGFLSTHPDPMARQARILEDLEGEELSGLRVGRETFVRALDGMIFGTNPREGFFEEEVFFHPEMAFRLDYPRGWATANTRTEVQGVSPQHDAVVTLSLADGTSPASARDAFLGRSGVETERRWDDPVNGLPAAWAEFRATTDRGPFRGVALYVRHGDRLFQVLGYAPSGAWAARRDVVLGSLRSFQAVTDPEILGVEPRRVRIVEVPREMGLDAFLREFPSTVPDETVAAINQLEAGDRVPAGTLLKRVVGGR